MNDLLRKRIKDLILETIRNELEIDILVTQSNDNNGEEVTEIEVVVTLEGLEVSRKRDWIY